MLMKEDTYSNSKVKDEQNNFSVNKFDVSGGLLVLMSIKIKELSKINLNIPKEQT